MRPGVPTTMCAPCSRLASCGRIVLPPAAYEHEQEKIKTRLPAAINFVRDNKLNEWMGPKQGKVGIIMQGGMYNNVILHESTRIPVSPTNASARRAVVAGAQALAMAFGRSFGKGTFSWSEELFDYENQLGVAAGCQAGIVKTRFNGSDFGTVVVPTYAVAH